MVRNQLAIGLTRFVVTVASLWQAERQNERSPDKTMSTDRADDDDYGEAGIRPYWPESHRERIESSLHMSC
jgi:hypothetical protein